MAQYHAKSLIKPTTGRRRPAHKKKKYEIGGNWIETKIGKNHAATIRTRGGKIKKNLLRAEFANVRDATGKIVKTKITGVLEHSDNPHYVRRIIITKGCVVSTELGRVKVTSRPGQAGVVNGILLAAPQ
ncbi:MAG: 30S ribosomal protein S8e [archaeon]